MYFVVKSYVLHIDNFGETVELIYMHLGAQAWVTLLGWQASVKVQP